MVTMIKGQEFSNIHIMPDEQFLFKNPLAKSGFMLGESRLCFNCKNLSYVNGVLIQSNEKEIQSLQDKNIKFIPSEIDEYCPEITDFGESICQFCGQYE